MEDFRIPKLLSNTLQRAKKIEIVKKKNFNLIRIVKQNFSSSAPNCGDTNCCSCFKASAVYGTK